MSSSYPVDFTLIDSTKEKSSFTVYHDEVTVTTLPILLAEVNDFKAAVNALCFNSISGFDNPLPIPASKYAQKVNKLVITYYSGDNRDRDNCHGQHWSSSHDACVMGQPKCIRAS